MSRLIEFLKSLFHKSAEALVAERTEILKVFSDAADDLEVLNAKIDTAFNKHDAKITAAQAKIDKSAAQQVALVEAKAGNKKVADKIKALLS